MSIVTDVKVRALEERVEALEAELASMRAALALADEMPQRRPGRPRKHEDKDVGRA